MYFVISLFAATKITAVEAESTLEKYGNFLIEDRLSRWEVYVLSNKICLKEKISQ